MYKNLMSVHNTRVQKEEHVRMEVGTERGAA